MPLSEQEQRLLDEMERHLMRNDADVVTTGGSGRALSYRNIVYGSILVLAGLGALIVGISLQVIIVGVLAFLLMVGGVVLAITPAKNGAVRTEQTGTKKKPAPTTGSSSFMDRMNDRWDRRQDGR